MKKIALALAGASVAITGVAATPASAADFRGDERGSYEQLQTRNYGQTTTSRRIGWGTTSASAMTTAPRGTAGSGAIASTAAMPATTW